MNIKELLNIYNINARDVKIHMAIGRKTKNEPWVQLTNNNFKNWQENQTKENFKRDYILSFVYLRKNEWLFAGIYTPDSCIKLPDSYQYETTLTKHGLEFIGRLVIFFLITIEPQPVLITELASRACEYNLSITDPPSFPNQIFG